MTRIAKPAAGYTHGKIVAQGGRNVASLRRATTMVFGLILWVLANVTGPAIRAAHADAPASPTSLRTHNLFQSHMVLQRDKPLPVWGWATPGAPVTVSFGGQQADTTAAADGSWKVKLPAMPANSEPQSMTIQSGETTLRYADILVGDIWVLGGQSNMEMPLANVENGALEIVSANFPQIRIASVPQVAGTQPTRDWPSPLEHEKAKDHSDCRGVWHECSPETIREFSAIGYAFIRRIHMASRVPIGVIDASRWGTTVEAWTPQPPQRKLDSPAVRETLAEWDTRVKDYHPETALAARIKAYNERTERMRAEGEDVSGRTPPTEAGPGPLEDFNYPGNCYAGMIAPLEGFAIKGAIFHQGFNNASMRGAALYRHVFPEMITAWRAAFEDPQMPFCILSLCTDGEYQTRDNFTEMMANAGQYVRESQYQTFLQFYNAGDKNIGYVSTYDLRRAWYHPWLKIPAGERAARWALATQYGKRELRWKPPMLVRMDVEPAKLVLRFDDDLNAVGTGQPMEGFAIAGEDREFHPADAVHRVTGKDKRGKNTIDAKTIELTSPMVAKPVHFRYAWARNPMGNIQAAGNSDIPLATQRSDDWPMSHAPLGLFGQENLTQLDRTQVETLRQALRKIDVKRRIAEAKSLLQALESAK